MPATTSCPSAANSGPRWSIVGIAIACSTRSGTLVGPGICRKWRPVCVGAVFFIATGSLLLDTRVWARTAIRTRHAVLRHSREQRGAPARCRRAPTRAHLLHLFYCSLLSEDVAVADRKWGEFGADLWRHPFRLQPKERRKYMLGTEGCG